MSAYPAQHRAPRPSRRGRTSAFVLAAALAVPVAGALPAQAAPATAGPLLALPVATAATGTWTVAVANANVRTGAGTQFPIAGRLSRGTVVTGTQHTPGWVRISRGRYIANSVLSGGGGTGQVTGQQVLNEASRYAGIMYRAGGSTPAGFDCSGYTQYVYRQLGLSIPRTVAEQKRAATAVSTPRPGDLVFFGTYHAAIFAGNGYIWDSGRPGLPVQRRAIWSYADVTYGRVAGVSN